MANVSDTPDGRTDRVRVTSPDGPENEVYPLSWKGFQGSFAAVLLNSRRVTVEKEIGTFVYEMVED